MDPDGCVVCQERHGFVVRPDRVLGRHERQCGVHDHQHSFDGSVTVIKHWVGGATGETPGVDLNISGPSSSTTHVTGLADGSTGEKPVVTGTYSAT